MKLVYLWVEEYKNIYRQGFNFSSRFECEFDGENLTICDQKEKECKNNEYLENFFGKNINVTAIVGKNGSGKSNLFECLIEFLNIYFINILNSVSSSESHLNNQNYRKMIFVINIKNCNYIITKDNIKVSTSYPKELLLANEENKDKYIMVVEKLKEKLFLLHYDYSFSKFRNFNLELDINSSSPFSAGWYHDFYRGDNDLIVLLPRKSGNYLNDNVLTNTNYDKSIIIDYLISEKTKIISEKYFNPTLLYINISINIGEDYLNFKQILDDFEGDISKYLLALCYIHILLEIHRLKNENVSFNTLKTFDDLEKFTINNKEEFINKFKMKEKDKFSNADDGNYFINIYDYIQIIKENVSSLNEIFELQKSQNSSYLNVNIASINKDSIALLKNIPIRLLHLNFIDEEKNINFDDLSNGEKSLLRIRFYIESFISGNKDNYFILLDEPSNDMHPQWQKKFLTYLIEIFQNRKQNFHFIITSHSPFILSDLPKENVIFLEKYKENDNEVKNGNQKNGNSKNVTKDIDIRTFGANIHTLLSDGFFISDGLMGEFAKGKIEEILEYLNDTKNKVKLKTIKEEQIKAIIESIGEDFLRNKLLDLYYKKFIKDKKEKEKQILENKIKELQKQYDKLNK